MTNEDYRYRNGERIERFRRGDYTERDGRLLPATQIALEDLHLGREDDVITYAEVADAVFDLTGEVPVARQVGRMLDMVVAHLPEGAPDPTLRVVRADTLQPGGTVEGDDPAAEPDLPDNRPERGPRPPRDGLPWDDRDEAFAAAYFWLQIGKRSYPENGPGTERVARLLGRTVGSVSLLTGHFTTRAPGYGGKVLPNAGPAVLEFVALFRTDRATAEYAAATAFARVALRGINSADGVGVVTAGTEGLL